MKLYAAEPGAAAVRGLDHLVVSCLARVEVAGAIWQKHRASELSAHDAAVLVNAFEWDWFGDGDTPGRFAVVALTDAILESAARGLAVHALRAYDAVQLASALAAREVDPGIGEFACFDESLARAAAAEGFRRLS